MASAAAAAAAAFGGGPALTIVPQVTAPGGLPPGITMVPQLSAPGVLQGMPPGMGMMPPGMGLPPGMGMPGLPMLSGASSSALLESLLLSGIPGLLPPEIRALNERTQEKKDRLKRTQEEQRRSGEGAGSGGVSVDALFEADLMALRAGKTASEAAAALAAGGGGEAGGGGGAKAGGDPAPSVRKTGFVLMKKGGLASVQQKRQAKFLPAAAVVEEPSGRHALHPLG